MRRGRQTRQRRALAGEGSSSNPPSAQEANEQQMMASRMERRDWSSLPEHVVESISNLLLSDDVTEYIRFQAVCPGWRQSTVALSNTESRFRPRNWILITSGQYDNFSRRRVKDPCCFLNVSNGNYLRIDIPQFRQGYTPVSVVDGLLVLLKKSTGELGLLNPFSLSLTELPNVDSLLSIVQCKKKSFQFDLSSVNFLSSTVIVFCFHIYRKVVFARIGGDRWFDVGNMVSCFSMVSCHGQLYAAAWMTGEVMQFELEEVPNMEPRVSMKTLIPPFGYPIYHGLLEFEGQIFVLRENGNYPNLRFEVYKIDVENRMLIPTAIPRDRTFFASESRL